MSGATGVQFQVAGETLFAATWNDRQPFLNLHLISSSSPPLTTDTYPYPWTEVVNPSYQPVSIPADSVTLSSDSLGTYALVAPITFSFAAYAGPAITVKSWWIDDRRTPTPTPLWGGVVYPAYQIPLGGGALTIDSITLTLRDCSTPSIPVYVAWLDPFLDHTPTHLVAHHPLVGGTYVAIVGNFGIDGPSIVCTTLADGDMATFDDGTTAYRADFDEIIVWGSGIGASFIQFLIRWQDANNFWQVFVDPPGSLVFLRKVVAGAVAATFSAAISVTNNDCYHLSIYEDGTGIITIQVNFTFRISVNDATFLGNTKKGFRYSVGDVGTSAFLLNLLVVTPQNAI